jgi:hypothetical protein
MIAPRVYLARGWFDQPESYRSGGREIFAAGCTWSSRTPDGPGSPRAESSTPDCRRVPQSHSADDHWQCIVHFPKRKCSAIYYSPLNDHLFSSFVDVTMPAGNVRRISSRMIIRSDKETIRRRLNRSYYYRPLPTR